MGKLDRLTNHYMKDAARFADIFNYFMYGGVPVINPHDLREMDTNELVIPYAAGGKSDQVERIRDLLKATTIMEDKESILLLLGIENQSYVHYAAPVKVMLYDVLRYVKQIEEIAAEHKAKKERGTSDEFLSGFHKEDRLAPVITLIIYWSSDVWDGPLSIHDMIAFPNDRMRALVTDYHVNLISPATIDDFTGFHTELKEVFQYLKYSKNEEVLAQIVNANDRFKALDYYSANLLNSLTGSRLNIPKRKERINVCKAIDDMRNRAHREGREEGLREGLQKGIQKGIQKGLRKGRRDARRRERKEQRFMVLTHIQNVMSYNKCTAEQAMAILDIPASERPYYMGKL